MLKQFLVRHYRIIFRTNLIEGLVFLLLFSSGLARYRFALVFIVNGILSAINQYFLDNDSMAEIAYYYGVLKSGFAVLVLIALLFDFNSGQIFPVYPHLAFWVTILSVVLGYGFSLILYFKAGSFMQWISKGEIFIVCPNCSFENHKVVKKCNNCGYTNGIPLGEYNYRVSIKGVPEELQDEIRLFKDLGIHRKVPNEVIRGLNLANEEYILIAAKSPNIFYFIGVNKNGARMRPGWFILTNIKVICYYGWLGWTGRDFIPFEAIRSIDIVKDRIPMKEERFLEINTNTDSFRFLFGATTKNLIKRILFIEATNQLILDNILRSISKRLLERTNALAPR
jgi:hypothetical protein